MARYLISGAGSGIGAAIARRLDAEGHDVALLGRTTEKLQQVLKSLSNSSRHIIIKADIKDQTALHDSIREAPFETLDGVVANAGIGGENRYGNGDRWHDILATNLTGCYYLINECVPYLESSTSAYRHILIVSSILARLGVPGYSAYCASKAGLLGLMRSWAAEYAGRHILVNAVCPGWVDTEMAHAGIRAYAEHSKKTYEQALAQQMSYVPLGKMSTPAEIASLVHYLLSAEQNSFTGQIFDINNGALMP